MNLDELNEDRRCKHGVRHIAMFPCGKCIGSRVGVYDDYGGYGARWDPGEKAIHCDACKRELGEEDLASIIAASPRAYLNAYGPGPYASREEMETKLLVPHCEECKSACERCTRGKEGLCPEPACVVPKGHAGDHADVEGNSWMLTMRSEKKSWMLAQKSKRCGGSYEF